MTNNMLYKPNGYNAVSPYFVVKYAANFIDFLIEVFDGKELTRYLTHEGAIMHAEVQIDDSIIMLGNATEKYLPNELLLHVYVPDVDKTFDKAIKYGCTSIERPQNKEGEGNKRGSFKDIYGNTWAVSTQL